MSLGYTALLFLLMITSLSTIILLSKLKEQNSEKEKEKEEEASDEVAAPTFSHPSGFYPENFTLKLSTEKKATIYYTVDASDPKTSNTSKEFIDDILIYDRSSEPNIYSVYGEDDNSPLSISRFQSYYKPPDYPVEKAMVIRAVAKNEKGNFSEVVCETYFVTDKDLNKHKNRTVISLVTDPDNLFSPDTGIYVTGNMFQEWKNSKDFVPYLIFGTDPRLKGNFYMKGSDWEREAHFTLFNKGKISVQQNLGIRIKGNYSRIVPQKSFNLYAKKKYGKTSIDTDILDDNYDIEGKLITSYKRLSLRGIYDDSRIRDLVGRGLFYTRENLTSLDTRVSVVFLNGEYWGAYLIQEKLTDDFIEKNYLIPSKTVSLLKDNEVEEGPEEELTKLKEFCNEYSKKDLADETVYKEVENYINVDSLIELCASEIYISNNDWPGKNDGEFRNTGDPIEGNQYSDGKWRFIIIDLDYAMNYSTVNIDRFNFVYNLKDSAEIISFFFDLLMNNTNFQNKFINVFCDYANEVCSPTKVNKVLEKCREDDVIEVLTDSQARWGRCPSKCTTTMYHQKLDGIENFFKDRAKYALQHMKDFLKLNGDLVNLTIKVIGKGKVQINSIIPDLNNDEWTGKYFTEVPITIKAIPDEGYAFKEWSGYDKPLKQNDEITLSESKTITVSFEETK